MENPLLEPRIDVPFDLVSAEHVKPAIDQLLAEANQAIAAIAGERELSFASTFDALERATGRLEFAMNIVEHLESVATTPELRSAHNAVVPLVSEFWSSLTLNEGLYRALRTYAESEEAGTLDPTRARFVEKTLRDFQRHGAELDRADKARLLELDRELSQLTNRFTQNVLDSTNAFELVVDDESRLSGLPDSAREAARESARRKGISGFRFSLQAPSLVAVLNYADDAELRERIWRGSQLRGTGPTTDNRPIIQRILELRREKARLLDFEQFADLVMEDRMAKDAASATRFVAELAGRTRAEFERENLELEAFRRELEGPEAPPLKAWDIAYYATKLKKARYDFDEEELRPYFVADNVLSGVFSISERLFGVKIRKLESERVWDEQVASFEIKDEDGARVGVFHVDLFPRENKRDGGWMHGLIAAVPPEPNLAVFCANANPKTSSRPSLLTLREVETVFHEFGHLLHHCLSRVAVRSLAGTRVAHDFVELPSQLMENWCFEREAVDLFARRYDTNEPIPEDLFQRMKRIRNYRAANAQMRQLGLAAVDLSLHVDYDPARDGDVVAYSQRVLERYSPVPVEKDSAMIASFSHLFAHPVGYGAGYYAYKWAEVLDADVFSAFSQKGVFDSVLGRSFRDTVLARGDSRDPMDLFEEFMGRKPRLEALLERQGLAAKTAA